MRLNGCVVLHVHSRWECITTKLSLCNIWAFTTKCFILFWGWSSRIWYGKDTDIFSAAFPDQIVVYQPCAFLMFSVFYVIDQTFSSPRMIRSVVELRPTHISSLKFPKWWGFHHCNSLDNFTILCIMFNCCTTILMIFSQTIRNPPLCFLRQGCQMKWAKFNHSCTA